MFLFSFHFFQKIKIANMGFNLKVQKRGKIAADDIRRSGFLPGIIYGAGSESVAISAPMISFAKLYRDAGESNLVEIELDGEEPFKALVQSVQYEPVKGKIIHFDLRKIRMDQEMTATIELKFVGESLAVKELSGTFFRGLDSLDIRCLPKDLVSEVEVDISGLKTFEDTIRISDLKLPAGISVEGSTDTLVAKVTPPLTEEQLKAMEESGPASVADVEVVKKEKKEGEEGEDAGATAGGNAPAAGEKKSAEKKSSDKK